MVINLEQKKIHFDVRFILTYNIYMYNVLKEKVYGNHDIIIVETWLIGKNVSEMLFLKVVASLRMHTL